MTPTEQATIEKYLSQIKGGNSGMGQTVAPATSLSYLDLLNQELGKAIKGVPSIVQLLEAYVKQFCLYEFGEYEEKKFSRYLYTEFVYGVTKGNVAGIKPDFAWYEQNFQPPHNENKWVPKDKTQTFIEDTSENGKIKTMEKEMQALKEMLVKLLPDKMIEEGTK